MAIWAGVGRGDGTALVVIIPTVTPLGVDHRGGGRSHLASSPRSTVHESRQSPRNHRRKLALFGPGSGRGAGFQRRLPLIKRLRQTAEWYREKKWL